MGISNGGMQDTLLHVDLAVQSPIPKPRKWKRKSKEGKENLGENTKLCGFGEEKQAVSETLEAKEIEIKTNSMVQDTLLDVGLTVPSSTQKHLMDTTTNLEESNEKKKKKKKKKPKKGKENLGENMELCGFIGQKPIVSEILEVKEMGISNVGMQATLLDVDLAVQSPIPKPRKRKRKSKKGKENLGENTKLCGFVEQKQAVSETLEAKEMEIKTNSMVQDTLLDVGLTVPSSTQKHLMDATTNLEESNEKKKKKRKKKKPKKGKVNLDENMELCGFIGQKQTVNEFLEVEEMEISNSGMQDTLLDVDLTVQSPTQKHLMDTTTNLEECKKKKKKRRKKPRKGKENLVQNKELCGLGEQKQTASEVLEVKEMEISDNGLQEPLLDVDLTVQSPIQKHLIATATNLEGRKKKKKKKNRRKTLSLSDNLQDGDRKRYNLRSSNQFRSSASENTRHCVKSEDRHINDRVAANSNMNNFLNASHLSPERTPVAGLRRKLLILDVNGLLADVVYPAPKNPKADVYIFGRAVFMRPFCSDFLRFCFERFDVGIWSSRSKNVLHRIVDYILGDLKHKLLLFWDTSRCTKTEFKTLENNHKLIVFKELRKIWEKSDPNVPWEKGDYNESNTLLLDDSPYKALLNPAHTGIFPLSYSFQDRTDNSLGPGGDLRLYLEGLACADNCTEYVKTHPFGQSSIDESCSHWDFYSNILRSHSNIVK